MNAVPSSPMVAYCRPPSLKVLLVRGMVKNRGTHYEGNCQCLHPHCKRCKHLKTDAKFGSMVIGKTFRMLATVTRRTRSVIYLIQCSQCKKQYAGKTENSLHIRLNGHRSDTKNHWIEKPVAAHFNSVGHPMEDLQSMIAEKIHRENVVHRRRKESYWINILRSMAPDGMNLDPLVTKRIFDCYTLSVLLSPEGVHLPVFN